MDRGILLLLLGCTYSLQCASASGPVLTGYPPPDDFLRDGEIQYESYDIQVFQGIRFPEAVSWSMERGAGVDREPRTPSIQLSRTLEFSVIVKSARSELDKDAERCEVWVIFVSERYTLYKRATPGERRHREHQCWYFSVTCMVVQ